MTLKDDLLPIVDAARSIVGELGFRPYQVWVRVVEYAGPRPGYGAKNVTDTRLLVGGQDPKVREVKRSDLVAGETELMDAQYDIGPLTPEFGGGGVAYGTINPPKGSNATEVFFVLKGPGLPTAGLLCSRVSDKADRPLRFVIRVQGMGRKAPA